MDQAVAAVVQTPDVLELLIAAVPEEIAEALAERLAFIAQNNQTWCENLRLPVRT